jgi:hypothetical protein
MKLLGMILLAAVFLPLHAFGNAFYNRAPGFKVPDGNIAFLGSYYEPLQVFDTGSDATTLKAQASILFGAVPILDFAPGDKTQAVNQTNQSVEEVGKQFELPLTYPPFNIAYQNALLLHVLDPAHYLYHPGITQYCGGTPYVLIVVVDYYAEFGSSVNIREMQDGQKIDYSGKRSILEKDLSMFANQGRQSAVALEIFLVSTKDGSTVWQAHTISTTKNVFDKYYGLIP